MSIIGANQVEQATGGELLVGPKDLITPLARERAADLGINIVRAPAGNGESPSAPAKAAQRVDAGSERAQTSSAKRKNGAPPSEGFTSSARTAPRTPSPATLNALYRRGAPVAATLRTTRTPGSSGPRAAVIGAGHVGSIAALRLAESDLFDEVLLIDVVDGLAAGIALDLWHSAGLARFGTPIRGSADLADITGVDYVIVTAGRARTPGMTRTDLTAANAAIVGPIAERISQVAPSSVIVMVTNPLEEMTHLARLRSGFPPERVLGMAGVLDTARFCALVALTGTCRPDQVEAFALGSHGPEMVVPLSLARVAGVPLRDLIGADELSAIVDRTRDSGAEVVSLLKKGSAYFAPGQSAARMVTVMASGGDELLACAVEPTGQYGLQDTRVGLPVRLGRKGLSEIVELPLEPAELDALRQAADRLRERIREVANYAGGDLSSAR